MGSTIQGIVIGAVIGAVFGLLLVLGIGSAPDL
jgi:hypothetical protein